MEQIRKIFENRQVLLLVVALGLAARLAMATLGHNFDITSWFIVADIRHHGGNVYAETDRYNYGPVWFLVLQALDVLSGHHHAVLRYLLTLFLSLVDLGIFWLLCRLAGGWAAALFFLNPVSILITGYHCQFDNLAILLALCSVRLFGDDFASPLGRRKILGLIVLGVSLMAKHLFFAFPLWLALKQKGFGQKIVVFFLPVVCFLAGFAPYWHHGSQGILSDVFWYTPTMTGFFYKSFVPPCVQHVWTGESLWYLLLILFAFICRTRNGFESALIYSGVLVAFSASTANQYLVIPMALASVFPNPLFIAFTVLATIHICADATVGPHLLGAVPLPCNQLAVGTLCGALAWHLWRGQWFKLLQNIGREVAVQFGRGGGPADGIT
jgi:hypothetical protein